MDESWFETDRNTDSAKMAEATDLAFNSLRVKTTISSSWTVFNEEHSSGNPVTTNMGYMPIIQPPAHEFDTLNTVVKGCIEVSAHLNQEYTVITVDQAL